MKTYKTWWLALAALTALAAAGCGSTDTAASGCSTYCSQLTSSAATLGSDVATLAGDGRMTDANCTSLCTARN